MSRQLEQAVEERSKKRHLAILLAVEGGLARALAADQVLLAGFSASFRGGDCLLTLRAVRDSTAVVCFVGAEDLGDALIKAGREASRGVLKWRADKYVT